MADQTKYAKVGNSQRSRSGWVTPVDRRDFQPQASAPAADISFSRVVWFLLLHAPLMLVFRALPLAATLHSVVVVLVGMYFLLHDKHPMRVTWVLAYITGAELLWRGVEAAPVWEYGKYATLFLTILMILKYRLWKQAVIWPLFFVALLIPGIFISPGFDREAVAYQLAGPVALAVVSFAFSALEVRKTDLQRLFLAIMAPAVSMAFLMLVIILTNDITFFARQENELLTGWVGANQVASTLSLGATAAFFYVFLVGKSRRLRSLMILLFLGLLVFSVLTFSRAGLWNAAAAIAISLFFMVRERRRRARVLGFVFVLGILIYYVVFPLLMNVTGGALLARFSDFNTTGRDVMARQDLELFQQNPVWGVGVGQSVYYHISPFLDSTKNTHTEYTRLLAEHGIWGAVVILILAWVAAQRVFSRRSPLWKGISTGFTIWTLFYIAHSATRLVAPSFVFGSAAARFHEEEEDTHE